jgi:hypothetical protein
MANDDPSQARGRLFQPIDDAPSRSVPGLGAVSRRPKRARDARPPRSTPMGVIRHEAIIARGVDPSDKPALEGYFERGRCASRPARTPPLLAEAFSLLTNSLSDEDARSAPREAIARAAG